MIVGCLAFFLTAQGDGAPQVSNADQKKPQTDTPEAIAKAFKALEAPPRYKVPAKGEIFIGEGNMSPVWQRGYIAFSFRRPCADAIHLLSYTKSPVDEELLKLAAPDKPLRIRYRAIAILAARGNAAVVPLLDKMCVSKDPDERYLGWLTYETAIEEKKLAAPKDFAKFIALYEKESDKEVREPIEWIFANVKVRRTVPALIKTVKQDHGASIAIWALGEIGDKSAVSVIIAAFDSSNSCNHLTALGKLATAEAVDFLIKHLEEKVPENAPRAEGCTIEWNPVYEAAEALGRANDPRALPALEKHLERLKARNRPEDHSSLSATRIAIVRLKHKDPRDPLLELAEDTRGSRDFRGDALLALRGYDRATEHVKRILKIYKDDPNTDIKRFCIWLLADSKLEGITEAMMDHALIAEEKSQGDSATVGYLVEALNKRLAVHCRTIDDMRSHIKELRKNEKAK
jgi:HEAT repeat protein